MVEFTSVLHAVRCALSVQEKIDQHNNTASEERQLQLRIGVHLGDVVYQDNDIFGDGVNIASRLQERADPGGICISQDVYNQIRSRDEFRTEYVGEVELKNVLTPVSLYKVLTKGEHTQRITDTALRKAKEDAVLEARNKKLMEYVKTANDLIVKKIYHAAMVEVMKLQALVPGHHEIRDLEERVRKGKRAQASADFEEKKKVPKESVLEMYSTVIEQAYSEGDLTIEEEDILENLRKSLEVTAEEHQSLVQKFQKP